MAYAIKTKSVLQSVLRAAHEILLHYAISCCMMFPSARASPVVLYSVL